MTTKPELMQKIITTILSIVIGGFFLSSAVALPVEEVKPLIKKEYYPEVLELIKNAQESIYLVIYGIQIKGKDKNDMPYQLVKELIEARKRGVKMTVILETSGKDQWGAYVSKINEEAKKLLQRNGVQVYLDDEEITTHAKVLVVDGQYTILGSHNWTFAAFMRNNESSVKVTSKPVARKYIDYFYSIKR